jgi:hypothetical protein
MIHAMAETAATMFPSAIPRGVLQPANLSAQDLRWQLDHLTPLQGIYNYLRGPDPEFKLLEQNKREGNFGNVKGKCSYPPQIMHLFLCFSLKLRVIF